MKVASTRPTENANEPVEVEEWVDELEPETTYHYRVVAKSPSGTFVGKDQTLITGAATVEPAASSWSGVIGIGWNGTLGSEMPELVGESGAKMFRVPIGGTGEANDKLFLHFAEEGVKLLPNVVGIAGTRYGTQIPEIKKGSNTRGAWKKELRALFNEYGPEGAFWTHHEKYAAFAPKWWEIWNEPNYGDQGATNGEVLPGLYGQLLEATHEAVTEHEAEREKAGKTKAPVKILFGGVLAVEKKPAPKGVTKHMRISTFIKRVKHVDDYDALGLHPYAFAGNIPKKVRGIIAATRTTLRYVREKHEEQTKNPEEEKPIWITELGWPVVGNEAPGVEEVEEDGHHLLVDKDRQAQLLTSTFEVIKNHSGIGRHSYNVEALLFYNIKDNARGSSTGRGNKGPQNWDRHCGLIEDLGGVGKGNGQKRPSWAAFKAEAE